MKVIPNFSFSCLEQVRFDVLDRVTNVIVDRTLAFDVAIKDINDNAPVFDRSVINADVKETTKGGEMSLAFYLVSEPPHIIGKVLACLVNVPHCFPHSASSNQYTSNGC